jgi:hypothetical protein
MAVAMKDLEIRGAGNLLGGEQSGHIASVGFDLYMRLVGEAVSTSSGAAAEQEEIRDTKVDLPIDAHLPHDYIPSERLRLEAYRGWPARTTTAPSRRCARSWPTATARCPTRSSGCCSSRASGRTRGSSASPRSACRARRSASRRWTCARARRCACSASTRARS